MDTDRFRLLFAVEDRDLPGGLEVLLRSDLERMAPPRPRYSSMAWRVSMRMSCRMLLRSRNVAAWFSQPLIR